MTTESRTGKAADVPQSLISSRPLNLPTADQIRRNLAAVYRDQIIGAAKAGNEEGLDYWLARYVEVARGGPAAGQAGRRSERKPRTPADRSDRPGPASSPDRPGQPDGAGGSASAV